MERIILKLTIIILSFLSTIIYAQEFQGKAYYETQRKLEMNFDNSQMSDAQIQKMQAMIKNSLKKPLF